MKHECASLALQRPASESGVIGTGDEFLGRKGGQTSDTVRVASECVDTLARTPALDALVRTGRQYLATFATHNLHVPNCRFVACKSNRHSFNIFSFFSHQINPFITLAFFCFPHHQIRKRIPLKFQTN